MAADITKNPWIIPAASAGETPLCQSMVFIDHFEFSGYVNATDYCIVKDAEGRVIWNSSPGDLNLTPVKSGKIGRTFGLIVDHIDNGTVYVYIK